MLSSHRSESAASFTLSLSTHIGHASRIFSVASSHFLSSLHLQRCLSYRSAQMRASRLPLPISVRGLGFWASVSHARFLTNYACAAAKLRKAGIFSRIDDSGASIGKRYSRNDELGTPYGVTVDFASKYALLLLCSNLLSLRIAVSNGTVTLRYVSLFSTAIVCIKFFRHSERDTTDQRIGKIEEVIDVVSELVNGTINWDGACQRLPAYDGVQAVD